MFIKLLLILLIPQISVINSVDTGMIMGATTLKRAPKWYKVNNYAVEPVISAPFAAVINAQSGQILFKKNADQKHPIASITKLATVYTYLKKTNYDLKRKIKFLDVDMRVGGKRNVYQGEIGTALDYLNMVLIGSDNSAAAALARAGGFLDSFTKEADALFSDLKLVNTHFQEPTGLSEENTSTALELAYLAQIIFQEEEIVKIAGKNSYIFSPAYSNRQRIIRSTDALLDTKLFRVIAGKTGYTKEAGYCLLIKVSDSIGKEIIISILGAASSHNRFQDAKALAWWVFENFE